MNLRESVKLSRNKKVDRSISKTLRITVGAHFVPTSLYFGDLGSNHSPGGAYVELRHACADKSPSARTCEGSRSLWDISIYFPHNLSLRRFIVDAVTSGKAQGMNGQSFVCRSRQLLYHI